MKQFIIWLLLGSLLGCSPRLAPVTRQLYHQRKAHKSQVDFWKWQGKNRPPIAVMR